MPTDPTIPPVPVADVPVGEIPWPTDPEICPRLNRQSGKHAFIWKVTQPDTVICINCGQERKRTRDEDTVTVQSIPQDEEVPPIPPEDIFKTPEVPAEDTTLTALKQAGIDQAIENEKPFKEAMPIENPEPGSMPVGSIPPFTGGGEGTAYVIASPPPAPVEDVQVAAPAPAPGE